MASESLRQQEEPRNATGNGRGLWCSPSPAAQLTSSFANPKKSPSNTAALLEELPQLQPLTPQTPTVLIPAPV